jgi:hypothetical protein
LTLGKVSYWRAEKFVISDEILALMLVKASFA